MLECIVTIIYIFNLKNKYNTYLLFLYRLNFSFLLKNGAKCCGSSVCSMPVLGVV